MKLAFPRSQAIRSDWRWGEVQGCEAHTPQVSGWGERDPTREGALVGTGAKPPPAAGLAGGVWARRMAVEPLRPVVQIS